MRIALDRGDKDRAEHRRAGEEADAGVIFGHGVNFSAGLDLTEAERKALLAGDVAEANRLLGTTFQLTGEVLRVAGICLDIRTRRVMRGGETIALSPREFEVLQVLMNEPGRAFSRDEICERIWQREATEQGWALGVWGA